MISDAVLPLSSIERTMVMPFNKERHENVAEHSYMLSVVACALADRLDNELDLGLIAQYALVHDTVEIYAGDTSVWASRQERAEKQEREKLSLFQIASEQQSFPWIVQTIKEYEELASKEACFVYALDKMLPHMLIIIGDYHPIHPTKAAYLETEAIARKKVMKYPGLLPYFEELCQLFKESPQFFAD